MRRRVRDGFTPAAPMAQEAWPPAPPWSPVGCTTTRNSLGEVDRSDRGVAAVHGPATGGTTPPAWGHARDGATFTAEFLAMGRRNNAVHAILRIPTPYQTQSPEIRRSSHTKALMLLY